MSSVQGLQVEAEEGKRVQVRRVLHLQGGGAPGQGGGAKGEDRQMTII